jgi:hypothetical protein
MSFGTMIFLGVAASITIAVLMRYLRSSLR